MTHEIGHLLDLDHAPAPANVMSPTYRADTETCTTAFPPKPAPPSPPAVEPPPIDTLDRVAGRTPSPSRRQ
ncbi:matrixin family metalloprotease [Capillimicrobium parvum]|uniref:Peptidase M10 metallopeptidase domain-containing protein n=1 Tax=Capillimicrobium parvum TaxID=2884022 RepID=A0A9E7C213_9ACTN|nr:matrixin family metalloprotease [Capillimicrobium parvum]UGS37152.1 hypothetical protein DSM104329_03567 [Capillimicrobium parvum]